ncbi:hypothetical protein SERLA73DRAFT_135518, partial [Serpula lacrymans var. lacrymans S7.3]
HVAPISVRPEPSHPVRVKPEPHRVQVPHKPRTEGFVDQNQINQQNVHYTTLRARANEEGDQMAECFQESHEAYGRRDGALAKQLSEKGKAHKRNMERLKCKPGEVDLHGLYVKEAISFTDRTIQQARRGGDSHIRLIVGKGLHSPQQVAKIKPAMEELIQKHHLLAEVDPNNSGVLIVYLDTQQRRVETHGTIIGTDDIARRLQDKDSGCTIM